MADISSRARRHGRLLRYEPTADETTVLADGLQFANGVAVGPDERYVLVNETGRLPRSSGYGSKGSRVPGRTEVFIDNLPGLPDGISLRRRTQPLLAGAVCAAHTRRWTSWPTSRGCARLPSGCRRHCSPQPEKLGFVLGLEPSGTHRAQPAGQQ